MESAYDKALTILFGLFVTMVAWIFSRLHKRVDTLEDDKADAEAIIDIRRDLRDHRDEGRASMVELRSEIKSINANLIAILRNNS